MIFQWGQKLEHLYLRDACVYVSVDNVKPAGASRRCYLETGDRDYQSVNWTLCPCCVSTLISTAFRQLPPTVNWIITEMSVRETCFFSHRVLSNYFVQRKQHQECQLSACRKFLMNPIALFEQERRRLSVPVDDSQLHLNVQIEIFLKGTRTFETMGTFSRKSSQTRDRTGERRRWNTFKVYSLYQLIWISNQRLVIT